MNWWCQVKWNEKNKNTAEQRTRVNKLSSNFVVSSFRFIAQIKSENRKKHSRIVAKNDIFERVAQCYSECVNLRIEISVVSGVELHKLSAVAKRKRLALLLLEYLRLDNIHILFKLIYTSDWTSSWIDIFIHEFTLSRSIFFSSNKHLPLNHYCTQIWIFQMEILYFQWEIAINWSRFFNGESTKRFQ